jgi:hypothetical protein
VAGRKGLGTCDWIPARGKFLAGSADVGADERGNWITENVLSCQLEDERVDDPVVNGVFSFSEE